MKTPPEVFAFRDRLNSLGISTNDKDLQLFLPIIRRKEIKKGEIFLEKGEICKETYFNIKGLVRSFQKLPNGSEKTYVICHENHIFTEHTSFVSQTPSSDYIEALEDTSMLYFTYNDLMKLYDKSQAIERIGRQVSDLNFILAKTKLMSLMNDDAVTRYLHFSKFYENILHRIPQNIIASYLGITPQSFSRLKKELEHKNDK